VRTIILTCHSSANLEAIQASFSDATADILATTTGSVGGVAAIGQQFAGAQIDALAADIREVAALVQQVRVTAELVATNLTPGESSVYLALNPPMLKSMQLHWTLSTLR